VPDYYRRSGHGEVISCSLQKYMYIVIHPYFHDKLRIKYSRTEDVESVNEIQHPIVRECLKLTGIDKGLEIASFADVAAGTGLGSSSAFTVGLLNALYAYQGKTVPKLQLATEACKIEIEKLKEPIGKQDQFAVAYGNMNHIKFNKDETVDVLPIAITEETRMLLESKLRLYYVGGQRNSRDILSRQNGNLALNSRIFLSLKKSLEVLEIMKRAINKGNIEAIGPILDACWLKKKEFASGITSARIDRIYCEARQRGATGGKLLGAGGAGFLLLCHDDHDDLTKSLNLRYLPVKLDREGTKILYNG